VDNRVETVAAPQHTARRASIPANDEPPVIEIYINPKQGYP
jgi:hypothetical protein